MDRRLVIVVIGIVAAIVAAVVAVAVFASPGVPDAAPSASAAPTPDRTAAETPAPDSAPATTPGAYVEYSDEAIAQAEGRVLLFFHASWCPQCRSIEDDILAQGVPDGVTIIKVDFDSHQDLRQQYGVTQQTTFVEVDAAGAELQKHVAYSDPHLDAVVAAML